MPVKFFKNDNVLYFTILVVISIVFYGGTLTFPFLPYDDQFNLLQNENLIRGNLIYFWQQAHQAIYMPVTFTIWGIVYKFAGFNAAFFHFLVFTLHTVNAILVFVILNSFIKTKRAALIGSLLFLIHPIQVEVVAWVQGFRDTLYFFFTAAAFLTWVKAEGKQTRWASVILAALGLLSKPTAIVIVPVIIAYEFLFSGLSAKTLAFWKRTVPVLTLLPLGWLVFRINAQTQTSMATVIGEPALTERILIALDSAVFYLGKILYPSTYYMNYGRTPARVLETSSHPLNFVIVMAIAILIFFASQKAKTYKKEFLFFCAWAVLFFLPTSGLKSFDFQVFSTVADRYAYGVMVAVAFIFAVLYEILTRKLSQKSATTITVLMLAIFGFTNVMHSYNWSTVRLFAETFYEGNPDDMMGAMGLGKHYLETGKKEEAEKIYERVLQNHPENGSAMWFLFSIYYDLKKYQKLDEYFTKIESHDVFNYYKMPGREVFGIYFYGAQAYFDQDRTSQAEAYACKAKKLLEHNPAKTTQLNQLIEKLNLKLKKKICSQN